MTRVTQSQLEGLCRRVNATVNGSAELEPYERIGGAFRQVPNVYVLDGAYGGWQLHRNSDAGADGESHGVSDVFSAGYMPRRALYGLMRAFLEGFEAARTAQPPAYTRANARYIDAADYDAGARG